MINKSDYKKILITPKIILLKKFLKKINKQKDKIEFETNTNSNTYKSKPEWFSINDESYFKIPDYKYLEKFSHEIKTLANNYINHKFILLGPEWQDASYGSSPDFVSDSYIESKFDLIDKIDLFINKSNVNKSLDIINLLTGTYKPIDWQLDINSGYRWDAKVWYKHIKYGNQAGAEVKVPWELGRFQHLIIILYAIIIYKKEDNTDNVRNFAVELRNQILDFIGANPPNFGVQWKTTMDVSIRLVTLLIVLDLIKNLKLKYDDLFYINVEKSIYHHVDYIINNLEYSEGQRGNHYFFNISALIYSGAYLKSNKFSNSILYFGIQEFITEIDYQFYKDGGNFEDSLCYHYFVSEMIFNCIYIIQSLPVDKINGLVELQKDRKLLINKKKRKSNFKFNNQVLLSRKTISKINSIAKFCFEIVKPDGDVEQIGDNDSGKFIKLNPMEFFKIFALNQSSVLSVYGIISKDDSIYIKNDDEIYTLEVLKSILFKTKDLPTYIQPVELNKTTNQVKLINKPETGLYLYKSEDYYSIIKCGKIGQKGKGGHSHNDRLAITLNFKNLDFIVDSGTYSYTSYPDLRNIYRSTNYHNTLVIDEIEQNEFYNQSIDDLFWMFDKSKSKVLTANDSSFIGEHKGYKEKHKREVFFNEEKISIIDTCALEGTKHLHFHLHPNVFISSVQTDYVIINNKDKQIKLNWDNGKLKIQSYFYSQKYGVQQRSNRIIIDFDTPKIKTEFELLK